MDTGEITAELINESGLPDELVMGSAREVAKHLSTWTKETRARKGQSTLFDRSKFVSPDNPYEQMRVARNAVADDDVVSAAADVTEGLVLQGVRTESSSKDVADIFNQINADLDLDSYLRAAYREVFTYSQVVTATWWGWRTYKPLPAVRPNGSGAARRKEYRLFVPTKIITLDPTKVVPVGMSVFGEEHLAWHATQEEMDIYLGNDPLRYDRVMSELFIGRYVPSRDEALELSELGVDPHRLLEFNPERVWRHTVTKPSYQRFPDLRLRSTFRHLDLKQQLMESDRVMLVGSANYILLVRKGSEAQPGKQEEIQNLRDNFSVLAKLPIIVSDHRLEIEIVAPKLDTTLIRDKYDLLDKRILSRLFGSLDVAGGARGDSTAGITTRMVARFLETRRHMIRRSVERNVISRVWTLNRETFAEKDDASPSLAFNPRNVQLDNDSNLLNAIMTARQSRDLSRESFLEHLNYDQAVEAQRLELEAEIYDDIFKTKVPYSSADGDQEGQDPPSVTGRGGGRPVGGGKSPNSVQGMGKKRTSSGAPSVGGNGD